MEIERGHLMAPFIMMMKGGVPCRTLIDVGCADGTFSLEFLTVTGGTGRVFNLDANAEYVESLDRIRAEIGGDYRICAVSSVDGTAALDDREHEYWRALSKPGEGRNTGGGGAVECRTLDSLQSEHGLEGPFFIKMDIEGAELSALLGAEKILEQTNGLILETNVYYGPHSGGKFIDVYNFLAVRGFALFDILCNGYRNHDGILFQVYCAYLNQKHEFRHKDEPIKGRREMVELTYQMRERRRFLRNRNEKLIADLKAVTGR